MSPRLWCLLVIKWCQFYSLAEVVVLLLLGGKSNDLSEQVFLEYISVHLNSYHIYKAHNLLLMADYGFICIKVTFCLWVIKVKRNP